MNLKAAKRQGFDNISDEVSDKLQALDTENSSKN